MSLYELALLVAGLILGGAACPLARAEGRRRGFYEGLDAGRLAFRSKQPDDPGAPPRTARVIQGANLSAEAFNRALQAGQVVHNDD